MALIPVLQVLRLSTGFRCNVLSFSTKAEVPCFLDADASCHSLFVQHELLHAGIADELLTTCMINSLQDAVSW
jgi:hypothetical protein